MFLKNSIMKYIILALIVVVVVLATVFLPVMLVPDAFVIERAIHSNRDGLWDKIFIPSFVAKAKLQLAGIKKCELFDKDDYKQAISFLVASYDQNGISNSTVKQLISAFVDQGCNINSEDRTGLSPLHEAILFEEPALVEFLLNQGADSNQLINRSKSEIHGMNGLEFAQFLSKKKTSEDLDKIIKILKEI